MANDSSLLADASRASIAEHKAQWWQTEIPNYLQWSTDVGAIETTYTDDTTDNILQRAIGVKNAGVKYAADVGIAIKDYDVNTAAAREEYISKLMTIAKSIGDTLLDAERDKEIALADAELQKQLTGNESAYSSAVQAANDAYNNTTTSAEASRKSQEQTARSTMNTKLSDELKNKEADIAAAEREYDQTVASLDAQYGSASSNGDTGVEGATRRSAIKTRDAQYYAARDTSWANTLSGSTTLGTSPWTVKAIAAANGQAAYSISRANAQAAHDAAMLDAIEDWQLSSRESLTDLLFTEGQSRESYNVATSNVYANWENGVGNLLGDKPEGTGWEPVNGNGSRGEETGGGRYLGRGFANFTSFGEDEETEENQYPTIWPGRGPGHIPPPAPNPDGTLGADKEYDKLLKYIHTPGVDLTQIPLQLDGMHEKMAEFVANHPDVYKELTLKFGVSYQHKLNEFFKQEFTIEDANRDIFYQYYNFEHPTFYLDSNNTWFWSTSADVKAGYLKYILDEVGSRHDAVKNPILQAGDIAVWFSPYRSVLESGTHFAPEIRRAVIQANADLAREVALNAAGEKGAEVAVRTTVHFGKIALQQLAKNPEWMSVLMKGTKAPSGALTGGAARAAKFGHLWQKASLEKAITRHAGENYTTWLTKTGKRIYENPATGRQIVHDLEGGYFRIFQPNKIGGTKGQYLDMLGKVPSPAQRVKSGAIKNLPLFGDDLQQWTHFLIE